jgi:hypothetical protein
MKNRGRAAAAGHDVSHHVSVYGLTAARKSRYTSLQLGISRIDAADCDERADGRRLEAERI